MKLLTRINDFVYNNRNIIYVVFLMLLGYLIIDYFNKRHDKQQNQYYTGIAISYQKQIDSLEKIIEDQKVKLDFKYTFNQKDKLNYKIKVISEKNKKEYETYMFMDTNAKVRYFSTWLNDSTRTHFERLSSSSK